MYSRFCLCQHCPGFSWDRVNFHQKPGGDTARMGDPNWPNKQGIRYRDPPCWVLGRGAGRGEVNHGLGVRRASGCESCSMCSLVLITTGVVTVRFLCCSIEPSLSQPTSFAFFFRFSSPPHRAAGTTAEPKNQPMSVSVTAIQKKKYTKKLVHPMRDDNEPRPSQEQEKEAEPEVRVPE